MDDLNFRAVFTLLALAVLVLLAVGLDAAGPYAKLKLDM